ncbi:MAG: SO_0444 family Cu/Zn efflux transporter [Fibrobacter sp.]|uniref:SO_0444 family Cu/Zn efflux transporter n=1 Tax=Fibrobacter sp. TaxID=35828 RepID=UPI0025C5CB63|nr:SO_0444 family Cu/Zn efflux transporter [Fibrobacter sp.]MBQ7081421.1 SO_0444 family Cu/Zn efflux transporter [Fibrobacter sp.]
MDSVITFIKEFITLFSEMAPFLLLGFLLAGILHVWVPNQVYVPKISKPNFKSVLWAALFGVPLPICSCGVIPTSIALRREGASKGASVSFLISTPATGVDSILATYSLLGLPFAILRPIAAFVTAMFGGVLTNIASRGESAEVATAKHKDSHKHHEHEHHDHDHDREHHHEHCGCGDHEHCGCDVSMNSANMKKSFVQKVVETIEYGLVNMVGDVSKWLMIGLLLGALISAFVPNELFLALREYPILCMVCVLLLAMPMYTCATGSIPLALALVAKGITPGAALVLLMAGPATSIASMLVVGKAFGKRTLAAYLFSIAFGAMFFGFIVDTFFMDTFLSAMLPHGSAECHGHGALGVFDYVCAGLLAAFMIYAKFAHKGCDGHCGCGCCDEHDHCDCDHDHDEEHEHCHCCHEHDEEHDHDHHEHHSEPASKTYRVNGMSCSHCKSCVEKAAFALEGVVFAVANVAKKELVIEGSVDESALKTAIEEAGFEFGGEA